MEEPQAKSARSRPQELSLYKGNERECHQWLGNRVVESIVFREDFGNEALRWYFNEYRYVGVVTVEGITDVLEVPASLFVEGIVVVQDSIFV
ncbi:hypothetical protein Scep_030157 [Stephania cephalantha]|uniref:Uncharacterized protein n=1 Tax=Stephania cephalantha TaxID=152367 RepID=A0AAP0HGL8_9MAGN